MYGVRSRRPPPPVAAMSSLFCFERRAAVCYVNVPGDNATMPTGARSFPGTTGLPFATPVAARRDAAQGALSAPPVYTHCVLPASPTFQAPAPWSIAPEPGSAGLYSPARAPFYGTAGHIVSELGTPSPYRHGEDAGPASSFATRRQSAMFLTAPVVASASFYGSFRGEADASRSAVGHQTALTDNRSSLDAPFGGLHDPYACPVTPVGDAARSYARRGPVVNKDNSRKQ
ncbi:hypothetical protein BU14_0152s0002 [Porphyra umbilicalis]|uniref:Uncharacterized protein n=1 Tax=Porphyra umbilicalis TaxID=2786 RepID=A0A1X6P985_PORUM|nr:hypothetical protein BU14_0152s0002 [Porphyra umbilicalis]|eukprot:OSX77306.1 hypothetical protein BU14_0152s0002 [Porphyra umbilicalis]